MSKKIDIKRTLGITVTPLSIDSVEEMTRLIHDKKPTTANYEKTTVETEKGKRGRKPKFIIEPERLLRVSVDLPESVFIQLKVCVIQQKTDMKAFIRKLVEKEMGK